MEDYKSLRDRYKELLNEKEEIEEQIKYVEQALLDIAKR